MWSWYEDRVMSYFVQTRWGDAEQNPSLERMQELLSELDVADAEHPDLWLGHESGWTLSAHETGALVWENPDIALGARYMSNVPRRRVLELWLALARGDIDLIEREAWQPGIPPQTPEMRARIAAAAERVDRDFYDSLGIERDDTRCQFEDCKRGAVIASVFCRVHHFEQVYRRSSPFMH
jgi:hypothetical protein